ncbi:MAG: ATP-binding protein [Geminicoccaceae bacterium]
MLSTWQILLVAIGYLLVLFAVAYYADQRAERGCSLLHQPAIYALSIAVYCTSWTYYGSVGRATQSGLGFLPIYLGPTLVFGLGWYVLRKIVVIAKDQRITSIADFLAARYGKSQQVAGLVALIALVGTVPYIALQLKAVSLSIDVLAGTPIVAVSATASLVVAIALAIFAILFGARHIDATEHHEGVVVAIAFESVVKLTAFLSVGVFVTYVMYDGFGDVFRQAAAQPELAALLRFDAVGTNWVTLTLLSAAAIICLPRQFQVTVVGNVNPDHLRTAVWLFPLYLLLINIFVLPIALGGLLHFGDGTIGADSFVLALPLSENARLLALFVFVGGLSAATAMVIVATIAVSIMVCNDMVMPLLFRWRQTQLTDRPDLTQLLLRIRRLAILLVLSLGYLYFTTVDASYGLVSIGLVSFAASAQFAPVLLGALYWRGGTAAGALAGLALGFVIWTYTLFLPTISSPTFVDLGLFGIAWLRPYALFGLNSLDPISHALFWSLLANAGAFVIVSLMGRPSLVERSQATLFVDALSPYGVDLDAQAVGVASDLSKLKGLAERFLGTSAAERTFADYARRRGLEPEELHEADGELVRMVERAIAGAIGAASARVAIASILQPEQRPEDDPRGSDILRLIDETTQVLEYSRRLEHKSKALEATTEELRQANQRLRELDRLKDEFLSTVTHELRTPLTSIRALTELMYDEPDMDLEQRREFLGIVIRESERLTRLINQVLDIAKIEAGRMDWQSERFDLVGTVRDATASMAGVFAGKGIRLDVSTPGAPAMVQGDPDRIAQVVVNLLSNALKFAAKEEGRVALELRPEGGSHVLRVRDNGPGVPADQREQIFDRFHQATGEASGNPSGTGLGLAISRMIVEHCGGTIHVEQAEPHGACFVVALPRALEVAA